MDPFYVHNPGERVNINPNRTKEDIQTGKELPPLFQTEASSSCTMLIDSSDRYTGDLSDFRVKLNTVLRPRYFQLKRIVLPKIPNVNPRNNSFTIIHEDSAFDVTLDPGIYNTTTLANELTSKINAALGAIPSTDTVTTTYNTTTRNFTIESVSGKLWYFLDSSPFIVYGKNLAGFQGYSAAPTPPVSAHSSGIAGMLYCKYIAISSDILTMTAYSSSITSNPLQKPKLVGAVDMTSIYSAADFDVATPYSGVYNSLDVWAPNVSYMNNQKSSYGDLDFRIQDEFGFPISESLNVGFDNTLGIIMIFTLTF